eukprot:g1208.t1
MAERTKSRAHACASTLSLAAISVALMSGAAAALAVEERKPYIVLRYFESRGRAEPIRLQLENLGLQYEDIRYAPEDWRSTWKKSGKFPFEQLPSLSYCPTHDEKDPACVDLVQTHTIMRFLGRKFNAYDEGDRHWIDLVADGAEDFRGKYTRLAYDRDYTGKMDTYMQETLPTWLGHFERLKGQLKLGKPRFFVSDKLTHADTFVFYVLDLNERLLGPGVLDDYPLLKAFKREVQSVPSIRAYLDSDRIPTFANGKSAFLDNPANPPPGSDEL